MEKIGLKGYPEQMIHHLETAIDSVDDELKLAKDLYATEILMIDEKDPAKMDGVAQKISKIEAAQQALEKTHTDFNKTKGGDIKKLVS